MGGGDCMYYSVPFQASSTSHGLLLTQLYRMIIITFPPWPHPLKSDGSLV